MSIAQQSRVMAIATPLGEDKLILQGITGREAVNELFEYTLDLLTEDPAINPDDLLGQPATLRIAGESGTRYISGVVASLELGGASSGSAIPWRARLVPWPWLLSLGSDFRIFQKMTAPEIVQQVFRDYGFSDFEPRLNATYPQLDYVTQYRETHLDFALRLLEREGISFHFEHKEDHCVLVLSDHTEGFKDSPVAKDINYRPKEGAETGGEAIVTLADARELRPTAYAVSSFDFTKPKTPLQFRQAITRKHAHAGAFERYDHGLHFTEDADGQRYARIGVEAEQLGHAALRGEGDAVALLAGACFNLMDPNRLLREDQLKRYVATEVVTSARQSAGQTGSGRAHYRVAFRAVPADTPVRPRRTRPDPRADGPETAIVVGASGEEITTDEHGRVKVMFHWDRYARADDTSSCWVRVSTPSAGQRWGGIFLPRHGEEVIVDFLGGDPDRPIITGRVYNGVTKPPYELPANKTISGTKSNSSKGGQGFNELRFEDKKGEEQIFVHAEKNADFRVKNDAFEWVGHDHHLIVKNDRFEHVEANRSETVDLDHKELVKKDRHIHVKGKEAKQVDGDLSLTARGKVAEVFKSDHAHEVTGNLYIKAAGVVIEATSGVTIKSGSNAVVVDSAGITLKGSVITLDGSMVKINSGPGSPAASGSPGSTVAPTAPDAALEADNADPGEVAEVKAKERQIQAGKYGKQKAPPFKPLSSSAAAAGAGSAAGATEQQTAWVEIELVGDDDKPIPGARYEVTLPDGSVATGSLDGDGLARIEGFEPGQCKVTFPDLDQDAWEQA